jgi:hypothetical protein
MASPGQSDGPEFHGPINMRDGIIEWHPEHWMIQRIAARLNIDPYDVEAMGPVLERAMAGTLFLMAWQKSPWFALSQAIRHPLLTLQAVMGLWRFWGILNREFK